MIVSRHSITANIGLGKTISDHFLGYKISTKVGRVRFSCWSHLSEGFVRPKCYSVWRQYTESREIFQVSIQKTDRIFISSMLSKPLRNLFSDKVTKLRSWSIYSRTSLIRKPKGQSKVSVLERWPCPYKRAHHDNVIHSTCSFKCLAAKTRLILIFKLHLNLLIESTKTLSFSSIQHCTSQLRSL